MPSWALPVIYAVSLGWAYAHCLVTKLGDQTARTIAGDSGMVGATIILVTLHFAIRRYVWQEVEREARRIRAQYATAASGEQPPEDPQAPPG